MDAELELLRPADGRMIGGVCAAFARYFDVDVTLVRALAVLLGLLVVGLVAYIVCWVVLPEESS
jgi:phage shock protein C